MITPLDEPYLSSPTGPLYPDDPPYNSPQHMFHSTGSPKRSSLQLHSHLPPIPHSQSPIHHDPLTQQQNHAPQYPYPPHQQTSSSNCPTSPTQPPSPSPPAISNPHLIMTFYHRCVSHPRSHQLPHQPHQPHQQHKLHLLLHPPPPPYQHLLHHQLPLQNKQRKHLSILLHHIHLPASPSLQTPPLHPLNKVPQRHSSPRRLRLAQPHQPLQHPSTPVPLATRHTHPISGKEPASPRHHFPPHPHPCPL
jgi:hypothetical protein